MIQIAFSKTQGYLGLGHYKISTEKAVLLSMEYSLTPHYPIIDTHLTQIVK